MVPCIATSKSTLYFALGFFYNEKDFKIEIETLALDVFSTDMYRNSSFVFLNPTVSNNCSFDFP